MCVWVCLIIYIALVDIIINKSNVKDKNKCFLIIAGIGIIFIMGSRSYLIGTNDIKVYYNFYDYISSIPFKDIFKYNIYGFECGYVVLNKIFSYIFSNPQAIIYVEASICILGTEYFIYKNSQKSFDSLIYFICLGSMMFALSGFRQTIAMSICLVSVEFVKQKKLIPFLLCIMLACSFHQTAIVFIISYFLINKDFKMQHVSILIGIMIFVFAFKNQIISFANYILGRNYGGYIGSAYNGISYVIVYLIIIIMAIITKKEHNNINKIGINMTFLSFVFFTLGYYVEIAQRISWYFLYGNIIALPNLYMLSKDKDRKMIRGFFIILAIIIYLYRFSNNLYTDYHFFWQN